MVLSNASGLGEALILFIEDGMSAETVSLNKELLPTRNATSNMNTIKKGEKILILICTFNGSFNKMVCIVVTYIMC